ncbi:hypothetical protein SAMN06309944_2434 [Micrococcales bacterium KH10]|nr:hypothetical protein SAMN06309944_2434 [Micrococcales bacterium KH10]
MANSTGDSGKNPRRSGAHRNERRNDAGERRFSTSKEGRTSRRDSSEQTTRGSDRGSSSGSSQRRDRQQWSDRNDRNRTFDRSSRRDESASRDERPQRRGDRHTSYRNFRDRDDYPRRSDGRDSSRGERGGYGRRDGGGQRRFERDSHDRPRDQRDRSYGDGDGRQQREENWRPRGRIAAPASNLPAIPEGVTIGMLDRDVRGRLRGLTKENAEFVGGHLAAAGAFLDEDPELAYQHARAATTRGGRVDVVREALGIAAYYTERYPEAIRELRTYERISGSCEHLPLIADSERGRGMPRRAIDLWQSEQAQRLKPEQQVELGIVVAGARADLEQYDAGLAILDDFDAARRLPNELRLRLLEARIGILRRAGRDAEADKLEARIPQQPESQGVVVYEVPVELTDDDSAADQVETDSQQAETSESADAANENPAEGAPQ